VGARHAGLCPGLVDENQTPGVDAALIAPPLRPPTGDIAPLHSQKTQINPEIPASTLSA